MANRRFEMNQYRQVLTSMRLGDLDRAFGVDGTAEPRCSSSMTSALKAWRRHTTMTSTTSSPNTTNAPLPSPPQTSASPNGSTPLPTDCSEPLHSTASGTARVVSSSTAIAITAQNPYHRRQKNTLERSWKNTSCIPRPKPKNRPFRVAPLCRSWVAPLHRSLT